MTGKSLILSVSLLALGAGSATAQGAHNPHGEDSKGLWQINAKAASASKGHDISPWTTTHGMNGARLSTYRPSISIRPTIGFKVGLR